MKFNVKKYFQVLGITLGVIFLAFMVCMGFDFTGLGGGTTGGGTEGTVAVENSGTINVLVMCTDEDGLRTDAMMLASYNTEENTVNLLSIPRDMRMFVGNRYQKVNAAHAYMTDGVIGGATAACETITRLTGVPINFYIDFSFDGVAHVIDELGPVNFTIPDIYGDGVG
ncbi:MAG: LCP family protein, partial [Candidatus Ornithomonoglobus sp.]